MNTQRLSIISLLMLTLSACAPFSPNDRHAGICNQLNSKMIFSGGTSNGPAADIQRAEQPLIQQSYDANDCYVNPVKKKHTS
jgi:hypothetical protein